MYITRNKNQLFTYRGAWRSKWDDSPLYKLPNKYYITLPPFSLLIVNCARIATQFMIPEQDWPKEIILFIKTLTKDFIAACWLWALSAQRMYLSRSWEIWLWAALGAKEYFQYCKMICRMFGIWDSIFKTRSLFLQKHTVLLKVEVKCSLFSEIYK